MKAVEERLARIERILGDSGLGLLAELEVGPKVTENLGILLDPSKVRLISALGRLFEQVDALEKLADTLKRLEESGMVELLGCVSQILVDGFSTLAEPKTLKLLSHAGNALELLSQVEPTTSAMVSEVLLESLRETFPPEKLKKPSQVGLVGLLKALWDPEVQKGLGLLLDLLRAIARAMDKVHRREVELQATMAQIVVKN